MKSGYVVSKCESSFCPACYQPVDLLCPRNNMRDGPAFYLCPCGSIGQVGVAPVRKGGRYTVFSKDEVRRLHAILADLNVEEYSLPANLLKKLGL
jgi:hypothetical protein